MGGRVPIVVGILAIVGVVAWLVLRGDSDTATPAPPKRSSDLTPPAKVPTTTNAPSLPAPKVDTPSPRVDSTPTAEDVFSTEQREDEWADKTEAELAKRLGKIRGGKIESTECRRSQCRVVIAGSEHDVGQSVADLEGSRGLHGYANGVLLTQPERKDNGDIALRVFVRFDR